LEELMPVMNLTARGVEALKPVDGKRTDFFDRSLKGFFVRASASGVLSAGVLYKRSGRLVRYTIGQLPPLSLAEAREEGKKKLAEVLLGGDPQAEKKGERAAGDFGALVNRYIEAREPDLAATTAYEYRRMARAYLGPLARVPLSDLRGADLDSCLQRVAKKNGPAMANRLFQFFRSVCRYGRKKAALTVNPIETVEKPRKERTRKRVLSDAELKYLAAALEDATPPVRGLVTALMLLGQRFTETAMMRWTDLNLAAEVPVWNIPGEFRKGGRSHTVPLPPQAVAMLTELRGGKSSTPEGISRVFHGAVSQREDRWWHPVRDRMIALAKEEGVSVEPFVLHDIRRTCRTGLAAMTTPDVAERVIGHVLQGVREVYDRHSYLHEKHAALCAWARHVERVVSGCEDKGEVVSIRGRG
jgi:integrase